MSRLLQGIKPVCSALKPDKRSCLASLRIVYVGQSSFIGECLHGDLLPICDSRRGLVPGGLQVSSKDFQQLASWMPPTDEYIDISGLFIDLATAPEPDLTVPRFHLEAPYITQVLAKVKALNPAATKLSQYLDYTNSRKIGRLIGAGTGATPTGDDILTGALAASLSTSEIQAYKTLSTIVRTKALETTRASRHQLKYACRGEFASVHLDLIEKIRIRKPYEALRATAEQIGHTSGMDFLLGFLTQAAQILHTKESTCQKAS